MHHRHARTLRSIHRPLLALLGAALAACGGGGEDAADAAPTARAALHPVEGCVVDRHFIPASGTPVRALAADGRVLAQALSDGRGRFVLRLPAGQDLRLQVDRPQGESLPLRVDAAAGGHAHCLLDDAR